MSFTLALCFGLFIYNYIHFITYNFQEKKEILTTFLNLTNKTTIVKSYPFYNNIRLSPILRRINYE